MSADILNADEHAVNAAEPERHYYAPSSGGFYVTYLHGSAIPADAVEISPQQHAVLIDGQALGQVIAPPDEAHALPYLVDASVAGETESATGRLAAIRSRLRDIDAESVRSLRALVGGQVKEEDRQKLESLEAEAVLLRTEQNALLIALQENTSG